MYEEFTSPAEQRTAWTILAVSTFAFTICFAAWMMNGVLVTFLMDNGVRDWDAAEMGWLIGIPVLTGALFRLPIGLLTDKFGGRSVYGTLLVLSAVPMFLVSYCDTYWQFFVAGLGFGFTGTSFAVGIAFTSVWFPRRLQGTALGIFGGFVCPVAFGYLLKATGLWTTCWMFFLVLTSICLVWMHLVVRRIMKEKAPDVLDLIELDAMATPGLKV